jgi:DUF971 family protein
MNHVASTPNPLTDFGRLHHWWQRLAASVFPGIGAPGPSRSPLSFAAFALVPLFLALAGCTPMQVYPTLQEHRISLRPGDLEASGMAFLTPSTVTGQEQEKQAVALTTADVIKRERPSLRVTTLAETLGAVNKAGLADAYKQMYDDYRDTGLLSWDLLRRVAAATGARYFAQLKLQAFSQGSKERFGALGFRIVETQFAHIRLFFQIWDSTDGTIAWEGTLEMRMAVERVSEEPVMQSIVLERAAHDLLAKLP